MRRASWPEGRPGPRLGERARLQGPPHCPASPLTPPPSRRVSPSSFCLCLLALSGGCGDGAWCCVRARACGGYGTTFHCRKSPAGLPPVHLGPCSLLPVHGGVGKLPKGGMWQRAWGAERLVATRWVHVCASECACACVCECVCVCVCLCECWDACVGASLYACVCAHLCVHVCVCWCAGEPVCTCGCVCECV